MLFSRKLVEIADLVMKRNESEDITTYATTQSIDERLESLAKEMPESWWAIPGVMAPRLTAEAAMQVDHLFIQIWVSLWYSYLKHVDFFAPNIFTLRNNSLERVVYIEEHSNF